MESKKSIRANLDSRKGLFFEIGLFLSLLLVLTAFEWRFYEQQEQTSFTLQYVQHIDEETVQTRPDEPQVRSVPKVHQIKIVDNPESDEEIDFNPDDEQHLPDENYYEKVDVVPEVDLPEPEIFAVVEEMPEFPGGEAAWKKFIRDNLKYPPYARDAGIEGTVFVEFVVEPDGSISNIKVLRGIGGGCDEEAVRIIQMMPNWKPGKQRGRPVRVRFTLPITFKLI